MSSLQKTGARDRSCRLRDHALFLVVVLASTLGCGRIGFDPLDEDELATDASSGSDDAHSADGRADAGMVDPAPDYYLGEAGSATCQVGGETRITLSAPVEPGDVAVVRVVLRASPSDAASVTDPPGAITDAAGHTYDLEVSAINDDGSTARVDVFSTRATSALAPGDAIVATHPDLRSSGAVVEVFRGVAGPGSAPAVEVGDSSSPAATHDLSEAPRLLYAALGASNHPEVSHDGGWMPASTIEADCGGALGNSVSAAAYGLSPSSGAYLYRASLSSTNYWAAGVIDYGLDEP